MIYTDRNAFFIKMTTNNITSNYLILNTFLQSNKKFHRKMLVECQLSIILDEMLILCPNINLLEALLLRKKHLSNALRWQNIVKRITILAGDEVRSFPVKSLVLDCAPTMIQTNISPIITVPESELISEILSYPGSASIVRFYDDVGLFSNERVQSTSGAHPNNWIGRNMGDYWVDDELSKYKRTLLREREVSDYRYTANFFTGEKASYQVQARLVNYRGELARLVKVISCNVLT